MNVIGKNKLYEYIEIHPTAKSAVEDWIVAMEHCEFRHPQEIKNRYSSVSFLANNHCIFNISGNNHRLWVKVVYVGQSVLVKWIGTHADYDKKDFNKLSKEK